MVDRLLDLLNFRNVNDTGLKALLSKENLEDNRSLCSKCGKEATLHTKCTFEAYF
jgi:hypothetical protein